MTDIPTAPAPMITTVLPGETFPSSVPHSNPVGSASDSMTAAVKSTVAGSLYSDDDACGMRTNSACVPSIWLPSTHPPETQCEGIPFRQKLQTLQAEMHEMSTVSPGTRPWTLEPTSWITPTPSWPSTRPGVADCTWPLMMCRSVPQIVVYLSLTIASVADWMIGCGRSSMSTTPSLL
ncbi:hypothetical protein ACKS0A_06033 [Histoplasma ohiense]